MTMDYTSNSNKSKEKNKKKPEQVVTPPAQKLDKVIEGQAIKMKKGSNESILKSLIPKIDPTEMKNHILMDLVIPTIKKSISDTIETLLYPGKSPQMDTSKAPYDSYYSRKQEERKYVRQPIRPAVYATDDIVLQTRGQALNVLSSMESIIDTYDCVCVANLLELVGLDSQYTDNNYGWLDLSDASVVQTKRGGYLLDLPDPIKLPVAVIG